MVSFPVFSVYKFRKYDSDFLKFTVYGSQQGARSNDVNDSRKTLEPADSQVITQWTKTGSKSIPARVFHNVTLISLHLYTMEKRTSVTLLRGCGHTHGVTWIQCR
jgi:hypothetical protein